jgi:uncharacterized protein (TIGR03000 family)
MHPMRTLVLFLFLGVAVLGGTLLTPQKSWAQYPAPGYSGSLRINTPPSYLRTNTPPSYLRLNTPPSSYPNGPSYGGSGTSYTLPGYYAGPAVRYDSSAENGYQSSYYSPPAGNGYQSSYYSPLAVRGRSETRANVEVRVPPNAQLWFGDVKTVQGGEFRTFHSPPLERGSNYSYEVRARWTENGQTKEQTRIVRVRAGERAVVDFVSPQP